MILDVVQGVRSWAEIVTAKRARVSNLVIMQVPNGGLESRYGIVGLDFIALPDNLTLVVAGENPGGTARGGFSVLPGYELEVLLDGIGVLGVSC